MWKYRQTESFHLNGHIIGFGPQTQKLEQPYKAPLFTLAVKGLRVWALAKQYTWEDSLWTTLFVTDNTQETKLTGKIPLAGGSLWAIACEQQMYFRWNKSWKMRLLPAGYVSKDTGEIKQLGNFLLKILFGNMDTLVSFFECKGTWT